ncbi:MAG: ABC transporter permease subunit [Campylobacteraceae bacterium]|jgi:ABC-2 type transport system permease protein|nr:ABC transporter permease subunit [Campylobacteraceae bacterium]
MKHSLRLIICTDLRESFRSRWFLLYSLAFCSLIVLLFASGVTESRVQGFSGLGRLLLLFIEICIIILPIFILITTVRTIVSDRDSNVLEYLLSFPVSLRSYYFGRFIGRFIAVTLPIALALILSLMWAIIGGTDTPYLLFCYYILLMLSLIINFLGISFFISSCVKTQEIALGIAFFLWLLLLAFIDILLIGILSAGIGEPNVVFSIALANPLQVFRIGAISLFDPELTVIGPAAYFILDNFGKVFFSIYAILYPAFLGLIFAILGFIVFKKRDLV